MILDETKPILFYKGKNLFKRIEKALSCAKKVSLDITLWNTNRAVVYSVYVDTHEPYFPVHQKTFPELLAWLKQKELLLQKIEL